MTEMLRQKPTGHKPTIKVENGQKAHHNKNKYKNISKEIKQVNKKEFQIFFARLG